MRVPTTRSQLSLASCGYLLSVMARDNGPKLRRMGPLSGPLSRPIQTLILRSMLSEILYQGRLVQGEVELQAKLAANTKAEAVRASLGIVQFIKAVEALSQDLSQSFGGRLPFFSFWIN